MRLERAVSAPAALLLPGANANREYSLATVAPPAAAQQAEAEAGQAHAPRSCAGQCSSRDECLGYRTKGGAAGTEACVLFKALRVGATVESMQRRPSQGRWLL